MLWVIYNLLFPVVFVCMLPKFIARMLKRGGYGQHFEQRIGHFGRQTKARLREHRRIWVHAVSVGEVVAACTFIRRWQERHPGVDVVLSTTTTTGHATARRKLPESTALIYCPLDFFIPVRRALAVVDPAMLVIFEVEIWPNLIAMSARRGCPVVMANGRVSDRSAAGYARHRWFFAPLLRRFSAICVQTEEDAERIRRVAGDTAPVQVCNTMKFDQVPDVSSRDRHALLDAVFGTGEMNDELFAHAASLGRPLYIVLRDIHADGGARFNRLKNHPRMTGAYMASDIAVFEVDLR